jgi:hypothetical protein
MTFDRHPQIGQLVTATTPTSGRVAAPVARDHRGCPTQPVSDLPHAQARMAQIGDTRPSRPPVMPAKGGLLPAYVLIAVGLVLLIALALMLQVNALAPPLDGRPVPSPAPQAPPVAPHQ